ncbi:hypothetical protein Syun_005263 [Stephania yunnanensis]|uniref:Uncharacterized protein n=1 Tax=Stephania yunnanensis TaxID=152371 RepID=A0AAP0L4S4_9MAGN
MKVRLISAKAQVRLLVEALIDDQSSHMEPRKHLTCPGARLVPYMVRGDGTR